jgi:hypothetical protein
MPERASVPRQDEPGSEWDYEEVVPVVPAPEPPANEYDALVSAVEDVLLDEERGDFGENVQRGELAREIVRAVLRAVGQPDPDGKVPDSEFIGTWQDRANTFEMALTEEQEVHGETLAERDRLRKALELIAEHDPFDSSGGTPGAIARAALAGGVGDDKNGDTENG